MPKFKPKAILSRVLLGESRQKEDGMDYLCAGLQRYYFLGSGSHAADNHENDDDDRNSICSFSTTATANNLPGAGRIVDTYIFQPAGRWIERLAMRFTIVSLHPARIAEYMEPDNEMFLDFGFDDSINLLEATAMICNWKRNGSTIVAGMKGLVKQTQSNSINRSACALAALIRVSMAVSRKEIYANISRMEPIFYLETLVRSHPDKKWFLLLVKLARKFIIAIRQPMDQRSFDPVLGKEIEQLWPSLESAHKLRQRLIRVLEIYRSSGHESLEDTIGESCAICAEAKSTWISWSARGDAYKHILETVYFALIFILRSIHELTYFARVTANKHIFMVLRTIPCLIDLILFRCLYAYEWHRVGFDMDLLKADMAFRSLIMDGVTPLPGSFGYSSDTPVVDTRTLPRRHRGENTSLTQSLIKAAKDRTRRLLISFDELEREVWGCTSRTNISMLHFEIDADPYWFWPESFGDEWWEYWKSTLERAQRVQVPTTIVTEEFREAQRVGLSDTFDEKNWSYYQLRHGSRHKWGQYLRSTMDWDWDLATCLKRLFKVEKQMRGRSSRTQPASSTAIDVAAGPGGTLEISMGDAQEESLPTAVRFAYMTKTGETRYMSFVPAGSGPGCQPHSEIASTGPSEEQILSPMVAQQVSEHRKGSFGGVQEVEDPETSAFPSDVSQHDTHLVEEPNDGCEWKEPVYNAGYDGFWAREDTISICSLD